MATLQEKQRTGILSKLNSFGPSGEKKDLMERVRRTSEQDLGDPERSNIRRKEQDRPTLQRQADLTARTREREYGAKVGTPEFGRALAAEYAEKYDKDKPPKESEVPKKKPVAPPMETKEKLGDETDSVRASKKKIKVPAYVRKHLDKMEDEPAMSDRERRLAQVEAAAEGARYREALQGRGAPAEAVRKMAEAGEVGDVRDVEDPGFAEPYEAAVKFEEEEYGGSLTRKGLVDEIAGYEYVDDDGRKQRARGEDDKLYSEEYSKAKEKNPDATEEELQDAALKAVMAKRAERAVLEMPKSFDVEATEDVGAGVQYEKTLDELRKEKEADEAAKKKDDVVSKAVKRVQGKTTPQPVVTPQDAAKKAFRKGLMEETEAQREAQKAEAEEYFKQQEQKALRSTSALGRVLRLREEDSEDLRKAQAIPGMEDVIPAISALTEGDLGGFNRTFGKRPKPGFFEYQGRKEDYRPEGIKALPQELKASLREELSKTVSEKENKVVGDIRKAIANEIAGRVREPYEAAGGRIPDEIADAVQEQALEISKLIAGTSDIAGPPRVLPGRREVPFLETEFGNLPQESPEIRKALEAVGLINPSTPDSQYQAMLLGILDTIPENQKRAILDLREGKTTLSLLGGLDTTPEIPVAEGTSAPTAARTSRAIPQEFLDKYPMFEDVDEDFTGLTVTADYGHHIKDLPEGKQFSHTIFPGNFDNLPPEQRYEYVVTTDGTKYLYKTNPEKPLTYLPPVEVREITELSPSESIIEAAVAKGE